MKALLTKLAQMRLGTFIVFFGLAAYFAATRPGFLDSSNLLSLARQYSELGVVAVGMTLVIAAGGIDISVGGTVGLSSMLLGFLAVQCGWSMGAAAAGSMVCAGLVGAINGFAISRMRMEPVLVTLATMSLTRGVAYILTRGTSIAGFPEGFQRIASGDVQAGGILIPYPVIITAGVFAAGAVALRKTTFGRSVLATGQSEEAARLSGVRTQATKFSTYFLLGLLGGAAGILLTSRMATSFADAGRSYEFEAITAVVLGGTSLSGGEGSLLGTLIGVATMAVLRNGLSLSGESDLTCTQMLAVALIGAVVIDNVRRRLVQGGRGQ